MSECESSDVILAWEDRDDPQAHRVVWWWTSGVILLRGDPADISSGQQVRGTGIVSDLGQWGDQGLGEWLSRKSSFYSHNILIKFTDLIIIKIKSHSQDTYLL